MTERQRSPGDDRQGKPDGTIESGRSREIEYERRLTDLYRGGLKAFEKDLGEVARRLRGESERLREEFERNARAFQPKEEDWRKLAHRLVSEEAARQTEKAASRNRRHELWLTASMAAALVLGTLGAGAGVAWLASAVGDDPAQGEPATGAATDSANANDPLPGPPADSPDSLSADNPADSASHADSTSAQANEGGAGTAS